MTVFLAVLRVIGIVILILFALLLVLLLLLLVVPLRYRLTEMGGSSETFGIKKTDPAGELTVSWLLHFFHGKAKAVYRENVLELEALVRILGFRAFRLDKKMKIPPEKQEAEEKPEEVKNPESEGFLKRGKELFRVLQEDSGSRKTEKIKRHLGGILKNILPKKGAQKVYFGTGDPFETATALGVAAFFYPLYKNTIEVIPDMAGSSFYTKGDISGRIVIGSVLFHAAVLYFDRDIRELLKEPKETSDGKL